MRKKLFLIVVDILLSTVVLSISSEDFTQSFEYKQTGLGQIINDVWLSILNFFKGGITGFVGYTPGANYNLTIWDDSDFGVKYIDENITFFANLTNGTIPINNSLANLSICINLPQGFCSVMVYNQSLQLWEFTSGYFPYYGNFSWQVNVTSAVENLSASDDVVVNETCLNISSLTSVYFIYTNRTFCPGVYESKCQQLNFNNVSGITINCNNSVVFNNCSYSTPFLALYDSNKIQINKCQFDGFYSLLESYTSQNITIDSWSVNNSGSTYEHVLSFHDANKNIKIANCDFKNSNNIVINVDNATNISITNCSFFNSSRQDIAISQSVSNVSLTNITTNFNRNGGSFAISLDANSVRVKNLKLYNARGLGAGVIFGISAGNNNSITDSVFENNSQISLAVAVQNGFYASNLSFKNVNISIADGATSNSNYTNLEFINCTLGLALLFAPSTGLTFQNSRFNNSAGIFSAGVGLSSSTIQNLQFYNSFAAFGILNAIWNNVTVKNITGVNLSCGIIATNGSLLLKDSVLDAGIPVNLSDNSYIKFLNVSFNKSAGNLITDSSLFEVLWYFNVRVKDIFDALINNANVNISNSSGPGTIFFGATNASGNIPWQNISEYSESAAGRNDLVYNLIVDASGYSRYNTLLRVQNNTIYDVIVPANGSLIVYSPVNGFYYRNRTINLTYRILYNNPDQCWYFNTTGNRVNLSGCANTTLTAKEGYNNITVFANSTDWNFTYARVLFYADTVFPNLTRFNISLITNISVIMNWTTSEETNMSFKYWKATGSPLTGANSSFANRSSFTISGLSERTSYGINVTFCDRAGNCILKTDTFQSGSGNYTPADLHIPEADIIVQELVASELTATPQRSTLTPGSRYIYTIDANRHDVKLKYVYMDERAVFEFSSEPVTKEIPKGGTGEVDLDNDGINDVALTVNNIEMTKVTFDLKRISFKKEENITAGEKPTEEMPSAIETPVITNGTGKPKTFLEKYGWYLLISLSAIVAIVIAGGAVLIKRKMPVVIEIEQRKKLLPPKTSHLESLMKNVYAMLKDNKTELDVQKYLEDMNFEDNVIKSIVFEMKTKSNKIDQMVSFAKKQFDKEKSVEEVREILENAGWARNIVKLATEE